MWLVMLCLTVARPVGILNGKMFKHTFLLSGLQKRMDPFTYHRGRMVALRISVEWLGSE